jgi:glutaredoxin-like protein NrdH
MSMEHVPGKNVGEIKLYALSTCPWCRKTKKLLEELGVEFYFEDVDLQSSEEKEKIRLILKKWNPGFSFPTLLLNGNKCIIGFKEEEIKAALKEASKP